MRNLFYGVIFLSTLLYAAFYAVSTYFQREHFAPELDEQMGYDGYLLYKSFDTDGDGYISLQEFTPIFTQLASVMENPTYHFEYTREDELLTVGATMKPFNMESLSLDHINDPVDALHHLKNWERVNIPEQDFGTTNFKAFLPENLHSISVGEVYQILTTSKDLDLPQGATLSNKRYFPPVIMSRKEQFIHNLLTMLHPRPFILSRFPPQGGYAIVQALNEDFIRIQFRIHAEFQLNEPPYKPLWFTPAYFSGHLTMNRRDNHVRSFLLEVPNQNKLNVDLEWVIGDSVRQETEVDIGFISNLKLFSTSPSKALLPKNDRLNIETHEIEWADEISELEASRQLEKTFYPFKELPYYSLPEALEHAVQKGKLLHVILLWGVLTDQSC